MQLAKKCSCGGDLVHVECRNTSQIVRWAGGVWYYNGTHPHSHPQPPTVHLTPDEKSKFTKLVTGNPKATPAALISGNTLCFVGLRQKQLLSILPDGTFIQGTPVLGDQ